MHKPQIELQLLYCFDVLMRERHVSRAAEKVGLSQSSMSEALARLRGALGDPLLVRGREGMVPTPRALELAEHVRRLLDQAEALAGAGREFDPRAERRVFHLVASDFAQFLLMPMLVTELAVRAPHASLEVLPIHVQQLEPALESGRADFALGLILEPAAGLRRRPLFLERSVCIARRGHPALKAPLDARAFASLAHIHVAPSGLRYFGAALDEALERQGLTRRVVLTSPHFLLAAHVVAHTDAVVFLPERVAQRLAAALPVQVFQAPLELPPYEIAMVWHERTHASPAHAWLRDLVAGLLPAG